MLHSSAGGIPVGHTHRSCEFPYNVTNTNDTTTLSLGNYNAAAQTIDVYIKNPDAKVLGYQFGLRGINITQVQSLANFDAAPRFNAATGEIIGLSLTETPILKNNQFVPLCRIHYSSLSANDVCIDHITAVLNAAYEKTLTDMATQCLHIVGTTATAVAPDLRVRVQPNPFQNNTLLQFDNPQHRSFRLEVLDVNGRLVQLYNALTQNEVTIERGNLASGMYFYRLIGNDATATGKLVLE
jgi:Secretion system C-terminal sorting domain